MNGHLRLVMVSVAMLQMDAATAQATQAQAFNEGKAYKGGNTAIKSGINTAALAEVPGKDATTTDQLTGLYGTNLATSGQQKANGCASYLPGTDAYKNAECDTINYVAGNVGNKPAYTIDKVNDPLLVKSTNIRNTADVHTAGTSSLSGAYTACTNQTTGQPERFDTERCQVGRPVTESQCTRKLNVTYSWQRFVGQGGADLRYGYCDAGQVRGDKLTIPQSNAYRSETTACASHGHGAGVEVRIYYSDCSGTEVLHSFDASACSAPPQPAVSNPPKQSIQSCTNAPRNNQNCFTPQGQFTDRATVPVFVDSWDNSACTGLDANGAVFTN